MGGWNAPTHSLFYSGQQRSLPVSFDESPRLNPFLPPTPPPTPAALHPVRVSWPQYKCTNISSVRLENPEQIRVSDSVTSRISHTVTLSPTNPTYERIRRKKRGIFPLLDFSANLSGNFRKSGTLVCKQGCQISQGENTEMRMNRNPSSVGKDWMCVGNLEMQWVMLMPGKPGWQKWVMAGNSMGNLEGKFKK